MSKEVIFNSVSRIDLLYRLLWSAISLLLAWLIIRDGSLINWIIGIIFLVLAGLSLFFCSNLRVTKSEMEIGVCGLTLRSVPLKEVSDAKIYTPEEFPVFYKFVFGVYFRGPGTWFFASGRDVLHIRWNEGKNGAMVSVQNPEELRKCLEQLGIQITAAR